MTAKMLEVSDLHAQYGTDRVLRGVTLTVARGEWFCLLGPNGVGKSTFLNCIAGRLPIAAGKVRVGTVDLTGQPLEAKRKLGVAAAPEHLPGLLSGRQCLEVYAAARELTAIDADVLATAAELRFLPFLDRCVDTYSLGTRQKLAVLLALIGNPQLIVLDEAFNGLDPASAVTLKRLLRERLQQLRCAVLLATHSLDIVEHCADTAALMLDGRIARHWDRAELHRLRGQNAGGLEVAMAAACGDGDSTSER